LPTKTQADALARVWRMLRDTGDSATAQLLTDTEIIEVITDSLLTYSLSRPRLVTFDLTASGTETQTLPTTQNGWVDDFSAIKLIETPTGSNPPNYIDPRKYALYRSPTGQTLRWLIEAPATGTTVRVTFTGTHIYGAQAANTTAPDVDFGAICALSASLAATAISSGFARTHEPLISADGASYRTKSMEWASVAKAWREVYEKHMASVRRPASGAVNWDTRMGGGYAHLTHDRWRR